MTARAHVKPDYMRDGVAIIAMREVSPYVRHRIQWQPLAVRVAEVDGPIRDDGEADWLRLDEDIARAIYEALADHFGHSGHDTRALRKDYEAERGRVDKFIAHLTKGIA